VHTYYETIWTQCFYEILRLSQLRNIDVDLAEVDRLASLVCQELRADATYAIQRVVQDPENKFDDPIPF